MKDLNLNWDVNIPSTEKEEEDLADKWRFKHLEDLTSLDEVAEYIYYNQGSFHAFNYDNGRSAIRNPLVGEYLENNLQYDENTDELYLMIYNQKIRVSNADELINRKYLDKFINLYNRYKNTPIDAILDIDIDGRFNHARIKIRFPNVTDLMTTYTIEGILWHGFDILGSEIYNDAWVQTLKIKFDEFLNDVVLSLTINSSETDFYKAKALPMAFFGARGKIFKVDNYATVQNVLNHLDQIIPPGRITDYETRRKLDTIQDLYNEYRRIIREGRYSSLKLNWANVTNNFETITLLETEKYPHERIGFLLFNENEEGGWRPYTAVLSQFGNFTENESLNFVTKDFQAAKDYLTSFINNWNEGYGLTEEAKKTIKPMLYLISYDEYKYTKDNKLQWSTLLPESDKLPQGTLLKSHPYGLRNKKDYYVINTALTAAMEYPSTLVNVSEDGQISLTNETSWLSQSSIDKYFEVVGVLDRHTLKKLFDYDFLSGDIVEYVNEENASAGADGYIKKGDRGIILIGNKKEYFNFIKWDSDTFTKDTKLLGVEGTDIKMITPNPIYDTDINLSWQFNHPIPRPKVGDEVFDNTTGEILGILKEIDFTGGYVRIEVLDTEWWREQVPAGILTKHIEEVDSNETWQLKIDNGYFDKTSSLTLDWANIPNKYSFEEFAKVVGPNQVWKFNRKYPFQDTLYTGPNFTITYLHNRIMDVNNAAYSFQNANPPNDFVDFLRIYGSLEPFELIEGNLKEASLQSGDKVKIKTNIYQTDFKDTFGYTSQNLKDKTLTVKDVSEENNTLKLEGEGGLVLNEKPSNEGITFNKLNWANVSEKYEWEDFLNALGPNQVWRGNSPTYLHTGQEIEINRSSRVYSFAGEGVYVSNAIWTLSPDTPNSFLDSVGVWKKEGPYELISGVPKNNSLNWNLDLPGDLQYSFEEFKRVVGPNQVWRSLNRDGFTTLYLKTGNHGRFVETRMIPKRHFSSLEIFPEEYDGENFVLIGFVNDAGWYEDPQPISSGLDNVYVRPWHEPFEFVLGPSPKESSLNFNKKFAKFYWQFYEKIVGEDELKKYLREKYDLISESSIAGVSDSNKVFPVLTLYSPQVGLYQIRAVYYQLADDEKTWGTGPNQKLVVGRNVEVPVEGATYPESGFSNFEKVQHALLETLQTYNTIPLYIGPSYEQAIKHGEFQEKNKDKFQWQEIHPMEEIKNLVGWLVKVIVTPKRTYKNPEHNRSYTEYVVITEVRSNRFFNALNGDTPEQVENEYIKATPGQLHHSTRNSETTYYNLEECEITPIKDLNPIRKEYLKNKRLRNLTWKSFNFMDVKDQLEKDGYEIDIVGTMNNETEVNIRKSMLVKFSTVGELLGFSSNAAHQLIKKLEGTDNINFPELQQYYVNIGELDAYVYLLPRDIEKVKKDLELYLEDIGIEQTEDQPFTLNFIEYIITISNLDLKESSPIIPSLKFDWLNSAAEPLTRDNIEKVKKGTKLYLNAAPEDTAIIAIEPATYNYNDVAKYDQYQNRDYWEDDNYFIPVIDIDDVHKSPYLMGFNWRMLDGDDWSVDFNYSNDSLNLNWQFSPWNEKYRGYEVGDYLWSLANGTNKPDAKLIEIGNPTDLVQKTANPKRSWAVFMRRKDILEKDAFLVQLLTDPEGVYRLRSVSSFLPKQRVEKYLEKLNHKKSARQLDNNFLWQQDLPNNDFEYHIEYMTSDGEMHEDIFNTFQDIINLIKNSKNISDVNLIYKSNSNDVLSEQIIYDGNQNLWSFKYALPEEREYIISQLKDSILGPIKFSKSLNWALNVNDYTVMMRYLKNGPDGYDFEYKPLSGLSFNEVINIINEDNTKGPAENYSSVNYIQREMIKNNPERLLPVFIYMSQLSPGDNISLFKDTGIWYSSQMTPEEKQEVEKSVTLPNRKHFTDN